MNTNDAKQALSQLGIALDTLGIVLKTSQCGNYVVIECNGKDIYYNMIIQGDLKYVSGVSSDAVMLKTLIG